MTREKIDTIIKNVECEISNKNLVEDCIEFNAIKIVGSDPSINKMNVKEEIDVIPQINNCKKIIKHKILKPVFEIVYKLSPTAAISIKNKILYFYQKIKSDEKSFAKQNEYISVLIDTTEISRTHFVSGIQRVVKNIIKNINDDCRCGILDGTKYRTNDEYKNNLNNVKVNNYIDEVEIDYSLLGKMVLLDSSWSFYNEFSKILAKYKKQNASSVYTVVYDLFPIKYPELFDSYAFIDVFTKWHNMILAKSDYIMCISKAVADDVIEYYGTMKIKRDRPLAIYYFPLGADLPTIKNIPDKFIRNKIKNFVSENTFLMVGTIEPRKGHLVALEAFTKRLDAGDDIKLLIIGRNGWKNEEFISLLTNNKYCGRNILWIDDANDIELAWCYQHACCLIAASKDEGYGLPLVEAAHYGVPIICSDIPVFREVAQGYADYFKVWDSNALADTIKQWLNNDEHPDSKNIKIYSWAEATKIFMEIVNGEREPYKIIQ